MLRERARYRVVLYAYLDTAVWTVVFILQESVFNFVMMLFSVVLSLLAIAYYRRSWFIG